MPHSKLLVPALAALLVALTSPPTVDAAESAQVAEEPAPRTTVVILDDGLQPRAWVEEVVAATGAFLHGRQVDVVRRSVDPTTDPLEAFDRARAAIERDGAKIVLWLESDPDGSVSLRATMAGEVALFGRRLELQPSPTSVDAETLSVLLRSVVDARLRDEPHGLATIPVPQPPPVEGTVTLLPGRVVPRQPPRGRLRLAVGYAGRTYAPQHAWTSAGFFGASWVLPWELLVGAGYTGIAPVTVDRSFGRITLARHQLEAHAGYEATIAKRITLGASVPVLLELNRRDATSNPDATTEAQPSQRQTLAGFAVRGRVGVELVWRVGLFAAAQLEVWPRSVAVAADIPEREVVLAPRTLRFGALAGVEARI